jgi:hypothetical protein
MNEFLGTGAVVLVAIATAAALLCLGLGLLRPSSAGARSAERMALACGALALVIWLGRPAIDAAAMRESAAAWSAEDRQLVQDTVPDIRLDSPYRLGSLIDNLHYWPLPFLAALVLKYRARRLALEERTSALTDVVD